MNLANKLTLFRVILVPVFMVTLLSNWLEGDMKYYVSLLIFIAASLTDFFDGYIARSRNMVTNFGKFMDPLADKMLVTAAMVSLVELGMLPAWVVIIILIREFAISGLRVVAASDGIVIAASWWGKTKTVSQMIMIILLLLPITNSVVQTLATVMIGAAVTFTIISGVDYIAKNKQVFHMQQ